MHGRYLTSHRVSGVLVPTERNCYIDPPRRVLYMFLIVYIDIAFVSIRFDGVAFLVFWGNTSTLAAGAVNSEQ